MRIELRPSTPRTTPYTSPRASSGTDPLPAESTLALLRELWRTLAPRRRRQFAGLLGLMIAASAAEVVSIGAVIPFLGILTAPEHVFQNAWAQPFVGALGLQAPRDLLVPATVVFACAALVAGGIRLLLLWASTRLSYATGADIGIDIYRRTLYQPYAIHVCRNTSEIIDAVTGKTHAVINGVIYPAVNVASSTLILAVILCALLAYQPGAALAAFAAAAGIYIVIFRLSRRRLAANSRDIAHCATHRIKALQEGLGGIRDVLIGGTQSTYCDIYRAADGRLRTAQAENVFIASCPRFLMEALGMVMIAGVGLSVARDPGSFGSAIPLLGGLALGAQRMLPMLQQLYQGWSSIKGSQRSLADVVHLLQQPIPAQAATSPARMPYAREIRFEGVSFGYRPGTLVLEDVDLVIPKGSRIGVVGRTGSGKSTFLDLLMGLLAPTGGRVLVDDVPVTADHRAAWQRRIAHVPQAIFLADATIEENIAFGVPPSQIDATRVRRAAEQAQLAQTIASWTSQYRTVVGERGVRLSGGQRQRIGIARALYREADVIILDEATSALDTETERAVMAAIEELDRSLTIVIIAHRASTLQGCDAILEVADASVRHVPAIRPGVARHG